MATEEERKAFRKFAHCLKFLPEITLSLRGTFIHVLEIYIRTYEERKYISVFEKLPLTYTESVR